MHKGYAFHWLPNQTPYFVTPSGNIVTCEVIGDMPYLRVGADHCQPSEPTHSINIPAMPASAGPCDDGDEDMDGGEAEDVGELVEPSHGGEADAEDEDWPRTYSER